MTTTPLPYEPDKTLVSKGGAKESSGGSHEMGNFVTATYRPPFEREISASTSMNRARIAVFSSCAYLNKISGYRHLADADLIFTLITRIALPFLCDYSLNMGLSKNAPEVCKAPAAATSEIGKSTTYPSPHSW